MVATAGPAAVTARELAETSASRTSSVEDLPHIEDAHRVTPKDARALSKLFLERLRALEEGTHEYQYVRNTLIEMNLSLVRFAAARFGNRPSESEDIVQVGTIGLIKAIDRFDVSREVEFSTFAIPYIVGEMKRFFRDTSWAVHVPRRLQELRISLARESEVLATRLNREPTVKELAEHLKLTEDEVIEGIVAANGYTAGSLDSPGNDESAPSAGRSYAEVLGQEDSALETAENLHALAPLLGQLEERERRILELRFGREMTQAQIGAEVGMSQMHVSRLLKATLKRLRSGMLT